MAPYFILRFRRRPFHAAGFPSHTADSFSHGADSLPRIAESPSRSADSLHPFLPIPMPRFPHCHMSPTGPTLYSGPLAKRFPSSADATSAPLASQLPCARVV